MSSTPRTRSAMIVAGGLQGMAALALHEWLRTHGLAPAHLLWVVPAMAVIALAPITFSFLRGEFSSAQSLTGAAALSVVIAAAGASFVWSSGSVGASGPALADRLVPGMFVFAATSAIVCFVCLPFLQSRLRERAWRCPYSRLFDDAWRNTLLIANGALFVGLFWLLLALWATLFRTLQISVFGDVFTSRFFAYPATALAIAFAVSLEEKEGAALRSLRRYLLAFKTRLLPLAALIALLFLAALPISGLAPLWRTGHATPLMLGLQLVIIALANAAWQDGEQPPPFARWVQGIVRAALALLPILSMLCIGSLSLRVAQYGWSVDRVWAAIAVGLVTLYALGYAVAAIRRGWLPVLGRVNTGMALLVVAVLLAVHTPLLDPKRIAASSQVSRLLSGAVAVDAFDFGYLRFSLGRPGEEALRALAEISGHPRSDEIRARARETLSRTDASRASPPPIPAAEQIAGRLQAYPPGAAVPAGFPEYLHAMLRVRPLDRALRPLRGGGQIPMVAVDLGGDASPEVVLMSAPFPVFGYADGVWRHMGYLSFNGALPDVDAMHRLLAASNVSAIPRQWRDLRVGDRTGTLILDPSGQP